MTEKRPDPEQLLARSAAEERAAARGRLKIFFGSNAGVGKTYAMLDEARKRAAEGVNVLVGYAEPHIRPDTEALLLGLDILPYKVVEHRGATLKEFDIDAALKKRPEILCIDELAHTNAPGMRHPKRWQDVYELLDAGINVYTTLNVQHLESVNDIVERISGIRVRETLPDHVVEQADEVELIDISPDELVERLREGKIYKPEQVERALKHFFNRGNLMALRELALRRTAERVDAQMRDARRTAASTKTWAASERILVCVGPSPFSLQLVRATKRLAAALRAPWSAVYVETPQTGSLPADARARLDESLRLAESLGATTITLAGPRPAEELLEYARQANITKIVVGKPERPLWRDLLFGSIVDDLIRNSGTIDIYVIRAETNEVRPLPIVPKAKSGRALRIGKSLGIISLCNLAGVGMYHGLGLSNANVLMLDLVGVLFVSTRYGRAAAIIASIVAVVGFDLTVVPPYGSLAVSDGQYLITFLAMLLTALVISALTDRIQRQADAARDRERRTASLFSFSRELAQAPTHLEIASAAARHVGEIFGQTALVFLQNLKGQLAIAAMSREGDPLEERETGVAQWVFEHGQPGGRATDTLPGAQGLYLPLRASRGIVGVLGVLAVPETLSPDRLHLLESIADQTALAVERATLAEESRRAWEKLEAEFLRNTLLSGVSHDLRTPLAAITGAASSIAEIETLAPKARRDLAQNIVGEAGRMNRLINNLLDMTRLESAGFHLKRDWHSVEELIGSALAATRGLLGARRVQVVAPPEVPLAHIDAVAIEQVFINLLENAARYTPPESAITITLSHTPQLLTVEVADNGPGLPPEDPNRVFQKFFRGGAFPHRVDDGSRGGLGLGLAICKGIIELHGGTISGHNQPSGGAVFRITLPLDPSKIPLPQAVEKENG